MVPKQFRSEFAERFHNDGAISNALENMDVTPKGKEYIAEKVYPFDTAKLPNSYYETLQTAFEDHQEIADDITRIFEATLDEITSK